MSQYQDYLRVLPRDLFNEAGLVKCLGRLWILLDETPDHHAAFDQEEVASWGIGQDPSSGAIAANGVTVSIHGRTCRIERPLNSRLAWPLWLDFGDDDPDFDPIRVFDEEGNLSEDMLALIRS